MNVVSPFNPLNGFLRQEGLPNLLSDGMRRTSDDTKRYNCIAWAADDDRRNWWPVKPNFWPKGVSRVLRLQSFIDAYATVGYVTCDDGDYELTYEKVVIYCKDNGEPTHAARQLDTGLWTSKLGKWWDVEHRTPQGAEGPGYGAVTQYVRRPIHSAARISLRLLYLFLVRAAVQGAVTATPV